MWRRDSCDSFPDSLAYRQLHLLEALILYLHPVLVVLLVVELAAAGAGEKPDIVLSVWPDIELLPGEEEAVLDGDLFELGQSVPIPLLGVHLVRLVVLGEEPDIVLSVWLDIELLPWSHTWRCCRGRGRTSFCLCYFCFCSNYCFFGCESSAPCPAGSGAFSCSIKLRSGSV